MFKALNETKTGKASGPSEVSLELIAASRGLASQMVAETCQIVQREM